jgi:hypothetical protein
MQYEYNCEHCHHVEDYVIVSKHSDDIDRIENCEGCGRVMNRQISKHISFSGEKVEDNISYFDPALGVEVSGRSHARRIAKERGLIEVGNESQNHLAPEEIPMTLSHTEYHETMSLGKVSGSDSDDWGDAPSESDVTTDRPSAAMGIGD